MARAEVLVAVLWALLAVAAGATCHGQLEAIDGHPTVLERGNPREPLQSADNQYVSTSQARGEASGGAADAAEAQRIHGATKRRRTAAEDAEWASLFGDAATASVSTPGLPRLDRMPLDKLAIAHRLMSSAAQGCAGAAATPLQWRREASAAQRDSSRPTAPDVRRRGAPGAGAHDTGVFRPVDYGADATGVNDSSDAFALLISDLMAHAPNATAAGAPAQPPVVDLGGAVIDLGGGAYRLTRGVVVPAGASNLFVERGTLFADAAFPRGATLLSIGEGCALPGGNAPHCGSGVGISQLTLHGHNVAAGGLVVHNMQFASVGPAVLVTGFQQAGITFNGTGGSYINQAWLGQFAIDDKSHPVPNATAIVLDGAEHDSYVQNTIIWSGGVGVDSQNGANQLEGVHTWNLAATQGGKGIILRSGRGRVVNCYLDFAPLVVMQPAGVEVSDSLFLGAAGIVFAANPWKPGSASSCENVTVADNEFHNRNATVVIDEVS